MDGYTMNLILYTAMVLFALLPFIIVIGVLLLPMCTGCETPGARKTYAVMQILLILVLFIATIVVVPGLHTGAGCRLHSILH